MFKSTEKQGALPNANGAAPLLQPKEFKVVDQNGKERTYILSKFPAIQGREIISNYPLTAMPKVGDYAANEEIMLKLMAFVAVPGKNELRLTSRQLVENHVPDWETLGKIEIEMMQYNCSFFLQGKVLTFFDALVAMATTKITSILTGSLQASSPQNRPPSTN